MPTISFLPKQREFMENVESEYLMYSSGYGSGKTRVLVSKVVFLSLRYPNNRIYICRKFLSNYKLTTHKSLIEGDGDQPPALPPNYIVSHNKTDRVIKLINGSEILYGGVDTENVKSLNISSVAVDEASEISYEEFLALSGRLRLSGVPVRQFMCVTNPSSPTHHLYQTFYANRLKDADGRIITHAITATTEENIYLPKSYIQNLKNTLFGIYAQRYFYGLWVGSENIVFDNFDPKTHIIKNFEIPRSWKRYRCVDFGYKSPTVILWLTIVPEDDSDRKLYKGDIIVYREIYYTERTASVNAERVIVASKYEDGEPEKIEFTVCDHSAGDRAEYESKGIKTIPADKNDKLFRIQKLRELLGNTDPTRGNIVRPSLYIFENTLFEYDPKIRVDMNTGSPNNKPTRLIEEFQAYNWKKRRTDTGQNDEPEDKNDHSIDALLYGIMQLKGNRQWRDIPFLKV